MIKSAGAIMFIVYPFECFAAKLDVERKQWRCCFNPLVKDKSCFGAVQKNANTP